MSGRPNLVKTMTTCQRARDLMATSTHPNAPKNRKSNEKRTPRYVSDFAHSICACPHALRTRQKHRLELLHELSGRLKRETALRHAIRELEMQRHLMGPGTRTKIRGPERADVESDSDDSGERTKKKGQVKFARQGEVDYAPRVYKWRSERRR